MKWIHADVIEYFNCDKKNTIWEYAHELAGLESNQQSEAIRTIKDAIMKSIRNMDYVETQIYASTIIDSIYRLINKITELPTEVAWYLEVVGGAVFHEVMLQGVQVLYLIDNVYDDLTTPLFALPLVFDLVGFKYHFIHRLVYVLLEEDNISDTHVKKLLNETRDVMKDLLQNQIASDLEDGENIVLLVIDNDDEQFEQLLSLQGNDGIVVVYRDKSPVDSSEIKISTSKQPWVYNPEEIT